jgi:uncharacterized pyridoxal phosphate-containing UPF0001 family protein
MEKDEIKKITKRICKKYNLIDNGLITTYLIGFIQKHNRRKLYRRFVSIQNCKNSIVKIELTSMRRKEADIFVVKKVVFTLNSTAEKVKKIFRYLNASELQISEHSIVTYIKSSSVLPYMPVVTILSDNENTEKKAVHKADFSQKKNYIVKFEILS